MTDTEKLDLIKEHAREYYENSRIYKFFKKGFIQYELFTTEGGAKAVYFADIFVDKAARGGSTLKEIIDFGKSLEHSHNVKVAYCKVEKKNKYIKNLQSMYARVGFVEHVQDDQAIYYRWGL